MATDFVKTSSGRSGANHAKYIAAEGRYADKSEVVYSEDFNLHKDAKTAVDFFASADKNEAQARSGKGRSYRDLLFALPHELQTKEAAIEYSRAIAKEICGREHAGRLGVHLQEGNWHLHLMFCERKTRNDLPLAENFARGKNNKVRGFASEEWLAEIKEKNLQKILKLAPDYVAPRRGEKHIGPKLKNAGASYEAGRAAREAKVFKLRADEKELSAVNRAIERLQKPSALDRVLSNPRPVAPAGFAPATIAKMKDRAAKPHNKTASSKLDDAAARAVKKVIAEHLRNADDIQENMAQDLEHAGAKNKAFADQQFRKIWGNN